MSSAYKHGRCDRNWSNSLHVMSNVKIFTTQHEWMDVYPAGQTNMTDYIGPHGTHMDKKCSATKGKAMYEVSTAYNASVTVDACVHTSMLDMICVWFSSTIVNSSIASHIRN